MSQKIEQANCTGIFMLNLPHKIFDILIKEPLTGTSNNLENKHVLNRAANLCKSSSCQLSKSLLQCNQDTAIITSTASVIMSFPGNRDGSREVLLPSKQYGIQNSYLRLIKN